MDDQVPLDRARERARARAPVGLAPLALIGESEKLPAAVGVV